MKADQEFENLRRLLKLKRYEKPAPRYFNDFSSTVIARIKADRPEDRSEAFADALLEVSWLHRIFSLFQAKPIFAGGFGAAVCLLMVLGIVVVQQTNVQLPRSLGAVDSSESEPATMPVAAFAGTTSAAVPGISPVAGNLTGANTPTNSIFDLLRPEVGRMIDWRPK
jgi:hypothetical protein